MRPTGTPPGTNAGTEEPACPPQALQPCRAAARQRVACPNCGRVMSLKTLHYAHSCDRTQDIAERANEMAEKAYAAINGRVQNTAAERAAEQALEQRRACWARLAVM